MNKRIQELAEQAGLLDIVIESMGIDEEMQKFSELIVQECMNQCFTEDGERIRKHFGIEHNEL